MDKKPKIGIPSVPSFLKFGDIYHPLTDFSEAALRKIGKLWTEKLLEKRARNL